MQNDPQTKPPPVPRFAAHQPEAGASLLFFLERGRLFLAREVPPPFQSWQYQDLSSARIRRDLPNAACKAFASALTVPAPGRSQAVHLALVVSDGNGDHLYLSLWNPVADTAWIASPAWIACPFDAGGARARVTITRVHIGDAGDRAFIVVDAIVGNDSGTPRAARYAIDGGRGAGPHVSPFPGPRWIAHSLPLDGSAEVHASCLGRSRGGWDVDGLYLAASMGEAAQLLYAPLYNPFNPLQPRWSRRLALPGKPAFDAIAACRNADNTSDLYVTAQGGLYYFSAANQNDGAEALALGSDPAFEGVRSLFAAVVGKRVTVWGLTRGGQVVHTSAPQVHVADPAAWRTPELILGDVLAIAPCQNGRGEQDAVFAYTNDGLIEVTRPSNRGRWSSRNVVLSAHAPPRQDA